MNLISPPAAEIKPEKDSAARHIFCALAQYHAANPITSELPMYGQAVLDAHKAWAQGFNK